MILGNASLKKYNTLRLEARADFFVQPRDEAEIGVFLEFVKNSKADVILLGGGSNIVFTEKHYSAVVCVLNVPFYQNKLAFGENKVCAFEPLASLIKRAETLGSNNLVNFSGIPGTVGGALVCNAGTKDVWFSHLVTGFDCLMPNGEKQHFTEYVSGYRTAELGCAGSIVTDVYLNISEISPEEENEMKIHILDARKRQPLDMPNAGSIFKNPMGQSAGELIEKAGLKGTKIGGAMVSETHANFIVNTGNAEPVDVIQLISLIQNKVKDKFNVQLELEVRLI